MGNNPINVRFMGSLPFRLPAFIGISGLAWMTVAFDAYILYRHRTAVGQGVGTALGVYIAVQLFYQWIRALRYMRRLRSTANVSEPVLRAAEDGITEILLYSYGMILGALAVIEVLLTRLDGVKW